MTNLARAILEIGTIFYKANTYMEYEIIYDEDINQYPLELNDYKIVYHNDFEILDLAGGVNQRPKIKGETKYVRILIKPIFKLSELTGEVIDEETKTIHKCHPFYTQIIAEQIMQDKIDSMKLKNHKFDNEQEEALRTMVLCLRQQNDYTAADEIEEQYLFPKSLKPLSYQEIIDTYKPLIKPEIKEQIIKRITPIYKLGGEQIPLL